MTKQCTLCKKTQPLAQYAKQPTGKHGVTSQCKSCKRVQDELRYQKKGEALRAQQAAYRASNKDEISERAQEYYKLNKDRINAQHKDYYHRRPDVFRAKRAKYRASQLNATPSWLSPEQLAEIQHKYQMAQDMAKLTSTSYHVDHIHPLQNDKLCGLHVPWNLRVVSAEENLKKGNKIQ